MKTFNQWNSELSEENQVPPELHCLGAIIWESCKQECAKLCEEAAEKYKIDRSLRVYTCLVISKSCEDLGKTMRGEKL